MIPPTIPTWTAFPSCPVYPPSLPSPSSTAESPWEGMGSLGFASSLWLTCSPLNQAGQSRIRAERKRAALIPQAVEGNRRLGRGQHGLMFLRRGGSFQGTGVPFPRIRVQMARDVQKNLTSGAWFHKARAQFPGTGAETGEMEAAFHGSGVQLPGPRAGRADVAGASHEPTFPPTSPGYDRARRDKAKLDPLPHFGVNPLPDVPPQLDPAPCTAVSSSDDHPSMGCTASGVGPDGRQDPANGNSAQAESSSDHPDGRSPLVQPSIVQMESQPPPAVKPRSTIRDRRVANGRGANNEFRIGDTLVRPKRYTWSPLSILLGTGGRPSLVFNDLVYYFAFGSNIGEEKLKSRGGGIRILGSEPAKAFGHRLAFNLLCLPPFEPAMASIEPEPRGSGDAVHGLLVAMERDQYELLYLTEGGTGGPWRGYLEYALTVTTYTGRQVQAVAFRTNPESPQALPRWLELPPSQRYRDLIIRGARSSGVDPCYVAKLERISAAFELG